MLELRINANIETDGTGRRVDGGSEEHKATRGFVAKGPVLVGDLRVGGNHVWRAKPTWMVL